MDLNFMTLNINGPNDDEKLFFLNDLLIQCKTDICFLQETHIDSIKRKNEIREELPGFSFFCTIYEKKNERDCHNNKK